METNTKENIMVAFKIRRCFAGGDSKEEKDILLQICFLLPMKFKKMFSMGGGKYNRKVSKTINQIN